MKNYILILMTVVTCLSLNDSVFGEENVNSQRLKIYQLDGSEREMTDAEILVMQQMENRLVEEGYDLWKIPSGTTFDLKTGVISIPNSQMGEKTDLNVNLDRKNTRSSFNEGSFYTEEKRETDPQRQNIFQESQNVLQALAGKDSDGHFSPGHFFPRNSNVRQALADTDNGFGFSDGNVDQAIAGEDLEEDSSDFRDCRALDEGLLLQGDEVIRNLAKGMDAILKEMKESLSKDDENKNLLEEMNIIRNLLEKNLDEDPNNDIHPETLSRLIERFRKLDSEQTDWSDIASSGVSFAFEEKSSDDEPD